MSEDQAVRITNESQMRLTGQKSVSWGKQMTDARMKIPLVDYSDPEEFVNAYCSHLKHMGLLLPHPSPFTLLQSLDVQCRLPRGEVVTVSARVVGVLPGPVYTLELLRSPETDWLLGVGREYAVTFCSEQLAKELYTAVQEGTLADQGRALRNRLVMKKRLAVSGGQKDRDALMRDEDLSVQIWVLKNPELTEDEVVRFCQLESISAGAMEFLLSSRRWGTSPSIARCLATHPATPEEAIPGLLAVLPTSALKELMAVAESPIRTILRQLILEREESE